MVHARIPSAEARPSRTSSTVLTTHSAALGSVATAAAIGDVGGFAPTVGVDIPVASLRKKSRGLPVILLQQLLVFRIDFAASNYDYML